MGIEGKSKGIPFGNILVKLVCACEVHVEGGGSVLLREVRTVLKKIEKKSQGIPMESKGN